MIEEEDPLVFYDRLRAETAQLLGLNCSDLTSLQKLRIDVVAALRLELDEIQSRQVARQPIDLGKLLQVSTALERLLPAVPKEAPDDDDDRSRQRLQELFAGRLRAREHERNAVVDELKRRHSDPRIVAAVEAAATTEPAQRMIRLIEGAAEIELLKIEIERLREVKPATLLLPPPVEPPPPVLEEADPPPWIDPNAGKPPPFVDGNPWRI